MYVHCHMYIHRYGCATTYGRSAHAGRDCGLAVRFDPHGSASLHPCTMDVIKTLFPPRSLHGFVMFDLFAPVRFVCHKQRSRAHPSYHIMPNRTVTLAAALSNIVRTRLQLP
jgi:hypothetical protein